MKDMLYPAKLMVSFLLLLFITGRQSLPVIAETGKKLSSVEVIHSEKDTVQEKTKTKSKKTLSDYDDFSLISYQTVENAEQKEAVLISGNSREERDKHVKSQVFFNKGYEKFHKPCDQHEYQYESYDAEQGKKD